jgi:PBP1b-binding outer membrane lipoprotein LpoB
MRKQVLFIAIFAIFLTGCNGQQQQTDEPELVDDNVVPMAEETNVLQEDQLVEEYDLNADLQKVSKIKDSENKTVEDCAELIDETLKINCETDVYQFMALETRDESYCNKIQVPDDKSTCLALLEEYNKYTYSETDLTEVE